jgi:hypothetical protein
MLVNRSKCEAKYICTTINNNNNKLTHVQFYLSLPSVCISMKIFSRSIKVEL